MSVLIFANGEMAEWEWAKPYLEQATAVIAADGGARHALTMGRTPDVVIGDMDSLSPATQKQLAAAGARLIRHDVAKDETDLELALLYAIAHYEEAIWLLATLGGRLDQALANVLLLAHPALAGRAVYLVEPGQRAWLVTGRTTIDGRVGDIVSLIPIGGDAKVAATTGLRWPLANETLIFGLARGVSNVMTAVSASVTVDSGRVLCLHKS
jgi:thiamine pyrophosphokinase